MTPEDKQKALEEFDRSPLFEGTFFSVVEDKFPNPEASKVIYNVVLHPGAAVMIPVLEDGRIVLIRQYRHPIQKILYEFPAGKLDDKEPFEKCAIRELREEIGMRPREVREVFTAFPAPGYTDEELRFFLATDLVEDPLEPDHFEAIDIAPLSLEEIKKKIFSKEITDCKTIMGIYLYENLKNLS